ISTTSDRTGCLSLAALSTRSANRLRSWIPALSLGIDGTVSGDLASPRPLDLLIEPVSSRAFIALNQLLGENVSRTSGVLARLSHSHSQRTTSHLNAFQLTNSGFGILFRHHLDEPKAPGKPRDAIFDHFRVLDAADASENLTERTIVDIETEIARV